uniref:Protein FAM136A n=1 Tax=Amphimedon queenslandica TaxID=400682 RepID=A0A1X7UWJ5_AMPQE
MAAEKKISCAMEKELESIDKDYIRPIQVNAFQCCAKCCQDRSVSHMILQNCLQNCMRPVSELEERIKQEVDSIQDRLTRCAQQCQDKAMDSLSSNPTVEERERAHKIGQDCLLGCADTHIPLINKMFTRLRQQLKG